VAASRRIVSLRGSLARHPKLSNDLAASLYGWVGEALRASIAERFTIDPKLLAQSVSEAVSEVFEGETDTIADPTAADAQREREQMERRLIGKLEAAGQLRPGYLLRALREGKASLFYTALGVLGGYKAGEVAKAINANRTDLLALACAGVGIDRSVFPTVVSLVQGLHKGRPVAGGETAAKVAEAFARSQDDAAEAFRAASAAI
jgi:uncharacterized protein (DUF2336 family)